MSPRFLTQIAAIAVGAFLNGAAQAAVTISSVAVLPTSGTALNFDGPAGLTGALPFSPYQPRLAFREAAAVSGAGRRVFDAFAGPLRISMTFSQHIQSVSFRHQHASGRSVPSRPVAVGPDRLGRSEPALS